MSPVPDPGRGHIPQAGDRSAPETPCRRGVAGVWVMGTPAGPPLLTLGIQRLTDGDGEEQRSPEDNLEAN